MILILTDRDDPTSIDVIEWLKILKKKFFAIYNDYQIEIRNIYLSNNQNSFELWVFDSKNILIAKILSNEIKSYWYRRHTFRDANKINNIDRYSLNSENKVALNLIEDEKRIIVEYLDFYLKSNRIKYLNSYLDNLINKLECLSVASNCGLNIPATLLTNNRNDLFHFSNEHNNSIITKNLSVSIKVGLSADKRYCVGGPTRKITLEDLSNIKSRTFPISNYQECIDKEYEVRVFYIRNKFFAAALFSQEHEITKIDSRNSNNQVNLRIVPYILPNIILKKLKKFTRMININCGSIDLIYFKNKFYFLEINPIGQIQWISSATNYKLEYEIAKAL
jgi:glutathione synthase/RimK-type ligase-like ATP-grasp enzyme